MTLAEAIKADIEKAVREERERCYKAVQNVEAATHEGRQIRSDCMKAIRALTKEGEVG